MVDAGLIGGQPALVIRAEPDEAGRPAFVEATVLPGRGMMLWQARIRQASGEIVDAIFAPRLNLAAQILDGGADDFAGNASFRVGGAILAPYANRLRGRPSNVDRTVDTEVAGAAVTLPRNWGGQAPGSEQYAMHGLILARAFQPWVGSPAQVYGRLDAGDFEGRWPGMLTIKVDWALEAGALRLRVTARNSGTSDVPVGLGWHPYFSIASGDRRQARLWLAARSRVLVNNYDEVLPTGELEPALGSRLDFTARAGRALGDLYLDDCFTDLQAAPNGVLAELQDPAAGLGVRLTSSSAAIRALQVYAPPDQAFVVIEPQFNLADPYGAIWSGRDTGMRLLPPGADVAYDVRAEPFAC